MNNLVDLHCHLDLYPDFEKIVRECEDNRIYTLGVTTTPRAWKKNISLTKNTEYIKSALGLHPQLIKDYSHELELFSSLISETAFIGEVGLDGSLQYADSMKVQTEVFKTILKFSAESGGKIFSIHSRGAATKVLDCLESHSDAGSFILHWFSGSHKELERAISMGCWFSVGPASLSSQKGREIAKFIPREKLLTETDGPFTNNGGNPLRPTNIITAIEGITNIWKCDAISTKLQILTNLKILLGEN